MSASKDLLRVARRYMRAIIGQDAILPIALRCEKLRLGSDYGGWTFCPATLNRESVVYSFGIGADVTFDLALIEKFGVTVHGFDPTPQSVAWVKAQNLPPTFQMHDYGIADEDGTITFYPPDNPDWGSHTVLKNEATANRAIEVPVKTLSRILAELGHTRVDLLKMDIEGAEYAVIPHMLQSGADVRQLLVEFHHQWQNVGIGKTKEAVSLLAQHGYQLFDVSPNGTEYAFLRRSRNQTPKEQLG